SANPINVTMDSDKGITATFQIDYYTLTVTIDGSGSVGRSPNLSTYPSGMVVKLTAYPATGWHFVGWSGDLVSSANPDSLAMNGNRQVKATFAPDSFALTVTITGSGSVIRSP